MAEPTFNLFGPISKDDIRVGYISSERGYVSGLSICEANVHAKKSPGTTFIYKPDRKTVEFLTINQVNKLTPDSNKDESCPDGLKMDAPPTPPEIVFMGGGGIGAVANPVIGDDGSVMAIDLVNGGFGYQYAPLAEVRDPSGIGVGAVIKVGLGTVVDQTIYYTDEEDFEDPEICADPFTDTSKSDGGKESKTAKKRSAYGRRWSPDGKDIGSWVPENYTRDTKPPFAEVVDAYMKQVSESGRNWWTTRKEPPLKVASNGSTTRAIYDVKHWSWGGEGTKTPTSEVEFDIHWHSPHRKKGLGFEFIAQDGSHSFKIIDTGKKSHGSKKITYQVKENTTYDVKVIGKRPGAQSKTKNSSKVTELAEIGLLRQLGSAHESHERGRRLKTNAPGTGDKIFADFLDTLDDADDLQIQAKKGKFTAYNPRKVEGLRKKRTTYNLTYRLQTGNVITSTSSFMNQYAISPVPPSNVKGSDNAGKWYTFEWDVDFPYDGEYVFHTARDNKSRIYIDNKSYTDQFKTYTGTNPESGEVGPKGGYGNKLTVKKGVKTLRLDLYNEPVKEQVVLQQGKVTSGGGGSSTETIVYVGLHSANKPIRVTGDGTRIELKDGHGNDTNCSLNITSGDLRFSDDGKSLIGPGSSTIEMHWNDRPTAGVAVEKITLAGKTWTQSGRRGSEKHLVTLNPPPVKKETSTQSKGEKTKEIFNTVDYINRANRQLWRTNVYDRGGFLNDYGVCPFDTKLQLKDNPYAGNHVITWPNVNFPIDGNYDIEIEVDDNVDLTIGDQATIEKKGFVGDTSQSTGKLKLTRFIKQGNHTIKANLEQKPGGAYAFRQDGKLKRKGKVNFSVQVGGAYGNRFTIPGLFSIGKDYGGSASSFNQEVEVELGKEYDVILTSIRRSGGTVESEVRPGAIRFREGSGGKLASEGSRLEYEDLLQSGIDASKSWKDVTASSSQGRFYGVNGNRCKFMMGETPKGINPMALAVRIQSTFDKAEITSQKSWNENRMGVALTIDAPKPPIPQQPVPKQEGRCPNNPFWTTRFPGAEKPWYPVQYKGWGKLLNKHAISPVVPYSVTNNPLVDVTFEVHWYSPHRTKGLGYRFTAQDGSHSFEIRDTSKTAGRGQRFDTIKVKENTTYDVKVIGKRAAPQGNINDHWGDNSRVVELAEQGLLKTMKSSVEMSGIQKGDKLNKLDANRIGTGDKIFADFLDTLDDSDDIQIQAGAGQFTAYNRRKVQALEGQRITFDLTYRVGKVPAVETGSFTNTWTKEFTYGGYYKVKMEVDDIGEFWIDDEKVLDLSRRKKKTYGERTFYISGPQSDEELKNKGPEKHTIKVVVENYKSENKKEINAKVFNTLDWLSGASSTAEKKTVKFKITSSSAYANSIKIPELNIHESKVVTSGAGGQINASHEREVIVNKVYDVEFYSSNTGGQGKYNIKYTGLHSANNPIRVTRGGKRVELKDGHGSDTNASLTINSGNVKFSSDGKELIINGNEAQITMDWSDNPGTAGVAIDSIHIGDKTWTRRGRRGSQTHKLQFARNNDNTANIKLRNKGESVVQMEDLPPAIADWDWQDLVCGATQGKFFDFNGNKCKYMVTAATKVSGGIAGGTTKGGVTYQGPHLFHHTDKRWSPLFNSESVSPIGSPTQNLTVPNDNILGVKILQWNNVEFPKTGKYQISFKADNDAQLFIDDKLVSHAKPAGSSIDGSNELQEVEIDGSKGKHDIKVVLRNEEKGSNVFLNNPTGVMLRIYTKMTIGTGTYRTWKENPIGVSAKLIPPPCPKKVSGRGTVGDPIVEDPGNGFPPGEGQGYPAALKLKDVLIKDGGLGYNCGIDKIRLEPANGAELSLCQCGPFGQIEKVCIDKSGWFTRMPNVIVDSPTGLNLDVALQFEVIRDPVEELPLVQVTDLVGLKQTGYYDGRPYYGAVFYQDGVKYAGWYETAGQLVQIYDTMQESIDGMVTTPPSAIQRQGSDPGGNDPTLNIPGTPQNLT